MEYMFLPFKRYFDFQGRSRRKEYWMFTLLNIIVVAVLMVIALGTGGMASGISSAAGEAAMLGSLFSGVGILIVLWALAVIIPSIAVTVRRLHDRDMSGWWYLAFIVGGMIPYIGFIASIALLVLMVLPGTPGPNRFGEDPLNPTSADVFA